MEYEESVEELVLQGRFHAGLASTTVTGLLAYGSGGIMDHSHWPPLRRWAITLLRIGLICSCRKA